MKKFFAWWLLAVLVGVALVGVTDVIAKSSSGSSRTGGEQPTSEDDLPDVPWWPVAIPLVAFPIVYFCCVKLI